MLRAVLFDLDDTLFPQADYLKGAWRAVAVRGIEWGIPHEAFARELKSVAAEGSDRGRIIDRALARVGRSDVSSAPLVDVFHEYTPEELDPYPGVVDGLEALGERFQLGLVTDGHPAGQRAKVRALGLDGVFDVEVYSDEFGREHRKPDPLPFLTALEELGVDAGDAMFVGDRPGKDVSGARAVGMQAIRVRTGEHASEWCGVPGVAVVDNAGDAFDLLLGVTKWSPRTAG